ncbi:hypothetical protein VLF92_12830 [Pseudomonas chengduensis]
MKGDQLTAPQSQISEAQIRASECTKHIFELLEGLERRLGSVLCDQKPEGKAVEDCLAGRCLLADQLNDHANKLEGAAARLRCIIDRIEL